MFLVISYNKGREANKSSSCGGDFAERILIGGIECCYAKGVFLLAQRWRRMGECKREREKGGWF